MPRALTDNGRVELRLRPEDKATLTRAASIKRLDLTGYILGKVLPQAERNRRGRTAHASSATRSGGSNPPAAPDRSCAPQGPASPCMTALVWQRIAKHDRAAFDCGDSDLNSYLKDSRVRTTKAARNVSSPRRPTCPAGSHEAAAEGGGTLAELGTRPGVRLGGLCSIDWRQRRLAAGAPPLARPTALASHQCSRRASTTWKKEERGALAPRSQRLARTTCLSAPEEHAAAVRRRRAARNQGPGLPRSSPSRQGRASSASNAPSAPRREPRIEDRALIDFRFISGAPTSATTSGCRRASSAALPAGTDAGRHRPLRRQDRARRGRRHRQEIAVLRGPTSARAAERPASRSAARERAADRLQRQHRGAATTSPSEWPRQRRFDAAFSPDLRRHRLNRQDRATVGRLAQPATSRGPRGHDRSRVRAPAGRNARRHRLQPRRPRDRTPRRACKSRSCAATTFGFSGRLLADGTRVVTASAQQHPHLNFQIGGERRPVLPPRTSH